MNDLLIAMFVAFIALLAGVAIGLCLLGIQHLVERVNPLDRWHYFTVYTTLGGSVGALVGVFWATAGVGHKRPVTAAFVWATAGGCMFAVPFTLNSSTV